MHQLDTHKLELNAPAGDWDCLKAAVYNGADSVYLGVQFFNARRLAHNFSLEELSKVVAFAHLYNVKIFLTMNTLVRNEELSLWFKTLEQAYLAGIDAVIIQEISLAPLIKKFFPGLQINASTQASLMNYQGINLFPDVDLVVLARELTAEDIKTIRQHTKKKLEVFVHGHLCISYSGQCLISSLIGKRSGNRGICASSCRKQYNNQGYLISAKDLMLADSIEKMQQLGVDAVKIEGRMKSPEYVAITTKTYREQINKAQQGTFAALTPPKIDNLKLEFNREFTSGFFENNKTIVGKEMPMNRGIPLGTVQHGQLLLQHAVQRFDGIGYWHPHHQRKFHGGFLEKIILDGAEADKAPAGKKVILPSKYFVNGTKVFLTTRNYGTEMSAAPQLRSFSVQVKGKEDSPLTIESPAGTVHSAIPLQPAKTSALTVEQLQQELRKSEERGVRWTLTSVELPKKVFLPKRFLRQMREELEKLLEKNVLPARESHFTALPAFPEVHSSGPAQLLVKVYSLAQMREAAAAGADVIYYDLFNKDVEEAKKACGSAKFFLDTPVVMTDADIAAAEKIIQKIKPDGIMIGNWGMLSVNFSGEKQGKYSLNVCNDITAEMLRSYHVMPMLSVELNAKQALHFKNKNGIYYAHGRVPVMHFKGTTFPSSLRDEKGYTFPLRTINGNTEMLYSRPIALLDKVAELQAGGITQFFLDLEGNITQIITTYRNILAGAEENISVLKKGTTIGNFAKGVA